MSFDRTNYLRLAGELIDLEAAFSDKESVYRCAISRAYIAIHMTARTLLVDLEGPLPDRREPHAYVRDWFLGQPQAFYRSVGQNLRDLRIERNKVDYETDFTPRRGFSLEEQARQDLDIARRTLANLVALRKKAGL